MPLPSGLLPTRGKHPITVRGDAGAPQQKIFF
jgi:hypothetical protein